MLYLPLPVGRICRECGIWKPRHLLRKNKKQPDGVEKQCLECNSKRSRLWESKHPEIMRASKTKWRRNNPEKQYAAQKQSWNANPEKYRNINNRWAKNHPDKARAKVRRRDSRKRQLPTTFTATDWERCLTYWHGVCAYCGNPPRLWDKSTVLTQDHFIPVTKNGGYTPDNILPACKACNSSKCDNDPIEWIPKRFGGKATNILKAVQDYFEWVNSRSD